MVGLWVENKSSPVQQYRIIFDDAKEERVSPSSPTKPVGWISKNSVSSTTSFSRACARYSDDALFAFTTFTLSHYCCPKNEWNSRTYAKKRRRFFRKSPTFFQKRPTFSRKAPSFLILPSHNLKNTVTILNCSGCWPTCFSTLIYLSYGVFSPIFHAILRETLKRYL